MVVHFAHMSKKFDKFHFGEGETRLFWARSGEIMNFMMETGLRNVLSIF